MSDKKSRYIPVADELILFKKQNGCCANFPDSNLDRIGNYKCHLWKDPDHNGKFDQVGYQIDHIIDHYISGNNSIDNLQLLCPQCHALKTKNTVYKKHPIQPITEKSSINTSNLLENYEMVVDLLKNYNLLISMGLVVKTNIVIFGNTIKHVFDYPLHDANNKLIKYSSSFIENHNALHVYTGNIHGGFIAIVFDCKNNNLTYLNFCIDYLKLIPRTLSCRTPDNKICLLFRLNDLQQKSFINYDLNSFRLFDSDIGIVYNNERIVMSSVYDTSTNITDICMPYYKLSDITTPVQLPLFIFDEIIRMRDNTQKPLPIIPINFNGKNSRHLLEPFLGCLNPKRRDIRECWLRIGAEIFWQDAPFELFDEWSKNSKFYDDAKKVWDSFGYNDAMHSIYNIRQYAKADSPNQYLTIKQKNRYSKPLAKNMEKSKIIFDELYNGNVNDKFIADLIHCLYPDKFIYDSKNRSWFILNKYNIYEHDDKNLFSLRELINTHIICIADQESIRRINNCKKSDNDKINMIKKNHHRLAQFLCTETKKDGIIRAFATLCRKKNIFQKLDSINPYIYAFKNGVYDLKNKIFRLPTPDEYVCCTCNYKYEPAKQKYIDILDKLFNEIFIDPVERKYVMMILSTALLGTNIFEIFLFFIGTGSNGKGIVTQLLDAVLGNYFGTLDIDFFNSKDFVKSGSANSALASCKNSRWVNVSEVGADVKLKDNRLKQLSGRDKIQARNLYGNAFVYTAKFKLCFQTNEKPIIDGADEAIRRRLRYITFRTKFTDNPTLENERKIDRDLKDRIMINDRYKHAFFAILLKYYYILTDVENMNPVVPQSFQADVDNYLVENDPVSSFIKDCLRKTDNHSDIIQSSDLFNEFKSYCNDRFIKISAFKTILEKNGLVSVRERKGSIYHNLVFSSRPSENINNENDDIDVSINDLL